MQENFKVHNNAHRHGKCRAENCSFPLVQPCIDDATKTNVRTDQDKMKLGYTLGIMNKAASCLGVAFREEDLKTKTIHTHVQGKKSV